MNTTFNTYIQSFHPFNPFNTFNPFHPFHPFNTFNPFNPFHPFNPYSWVPQVPKFRKSLHYCRWKSHHLNIESTPRLRVFTGKLPKGIGHFKLMVRLWKRESKPFVRRYSRSLPGLSSFWSKFGVYFI